MRPDQIAVQRMYGHHLWGPPMASPEAVVSAYAAMQAQEYTPAKWSIAQRAGEVTESAVDTALAAGRILRTHLIRPTWHFVLPADIRWLLDLTGPRVHQLNAYYYRRSGLDGGTVARSQAALRTALSGGRHLTRREVAVALGAAGIAATGLRLGYVLMRAELDAVVVSGAVRGRQQTYALFDERVPPAPLRDRDEALADLTTRYFTTRGPATVRDFATWSSLTLADARRGVDIAGAALARFSAGDREYLWTPRLVVAAPPAPVVDLIQGYDENVMSYSQSRDVLFPDGARDPGWDPAYLHTILLDGRVIGHWKHTTTTRTVTVETRLDRALRAAQRDALDAAVARFSRFLGRTPAGTR